MHLDAVNNTVIEPVFEYSSAERVRAVYEPWARWPPSLISHHGNGCCDLARVWISAFDYSSLNGGSILSGPRWLRHRFDWGPTRYPIYWCEAVKKETLDCGVHAALAHEVFMSRGVRSFRTQLVQQFSNSAAGQWTANWAGNDASTDWIDDDMIYHEGCAVVTNRGRLKLWDPSSAWWIDPGSTAGYGSLRALRIFAPHHNKPLEWGDRLIAPNQWVTFH